MKTIFILLLFSACKNEPKIVTDYLENDNYLVRTYENPSDTSTYLREFYYSNGQLSTKGRFMNNKMEGKWMWWHSNGQVKDSGRYENGIQEGQFVHYHKNGNLKQKRLLNGGFCVGNAEMYYENGQLFYLGFSDLNGLKQGEVVNYFNVSFWGKIPRL